MEWATPSLTVWFETQRATVVAAAAAAAAIFIIVASRLGGRIIVLDTPCWFET